MLRQLHFPPSELGFSSLRFCLLALGALCVLSTAACQNRSGSADSARARSESAENAQAGGGSTSTAESSPANSVHLHLDFDFGAGRLRVVRHRFEGEGAANDSLWVDLAGGEEADLEEFRTLLARQAGIGRSLEAPESQRLDFLAHDLGRRLLGPLDAVLSESRRWVVSPLSAAPLEALFLPWGNGEARVLQRTVVSYAPQPDKGSKTRARCPLAAQPQQPAGHGMLALIPYTPDLTPVQDDPDTLLWTLRSLLQRLDTIPRTETTPDELETVLATATNNAAYALILLRARPAEAEPLLPSLSGSRSLVWWVRPPHEMRSRGYLGEARTRARCLKQARRLVEGGYGVILDLWPRDDQAVKRGAKVWVAALRSGVPPALALTEAKRTMDRQDPEKPGLWASWIALGPCETPLELARPGLLKRIFSSRH